MQYFLRQYLRYFFHQYPRYFFHQYPRSANEIRQKFLEFFKKRGHTIVPSSSLLSDDPSVLLTTAGMQQFKPYYTRALDPEKDIHPGLGKPVGLNAVSVQKSFRTSDIDEVGDESHLTFFEMLGNFSFGGYFKEEAIKYAHEFITKELGLKIDYVSVFKGDSDVPADEESEKIWKSIGVKDIRKFGREDNFWGPTGSEGPCGPTTEIYVNGVEIWNLVFNEYYCYADGHLEKLVTPGVDTGMGLERLVMVVQKTKTIFETDLFESIIQFIPSNIEVRKKRILADHVRGIVFLISDGVRPSNKDAGYILRRLTRRVIIYSTQSDIVNLLSVTTQYYKSHYPNLDKDTVLSVFSEENKLFQKTLSRGLQELDKLKYIDAKSAFKFYETFGLPYEIIKEKAKDLRREDFDREFDKHQEISRAGAGTFKGGLADTEPKTIKLHTAHHLLLAASQKVLGKDVKQRGSNITSERLRMDFSYPKKLTSDEIKQVEDIVNQKIKEGLEVVRKEMRREEAEKIGAEMEFGVKYGDTVSVYFIQDSRGNVFSKEFCGGPHVENTRGLGHFKIIKEEAVGSGARRIRAILKE